VATFSALPDGVARAGLVQIGSELLWYAAGDEASTSVGVHRGVNGTTDSAHASGETVTFVETSRTRIHSIRSTIRSGAVNDNPTARGWSGRGFLSFQNKNSFLPLPPVTIQDATIEAVGGALGVLGKFVYWDGWRPDTDIQGLRIIHDGLLHTPADDSYGSAIGWDWVAGPDLAVTPAPPPRVFGRDVEIRVNGATTPKTTYAAVRSGRGYAFLDFDMSGEVLLKDPGGVALVNLTPPTGLMALSPDSRLGIRLRLPAAGGADRVPDALIVGSTAETSIATVLRVNLGVDGPGAPVSPGETVLVTSTIDPSQAGRVQLNQ
jgi:hypothetical protein